MDSIDYVFRFDFRLVRTAFVDSRFLILSYFSIRSFFLVFKHQGEIFCFRVMVLYSCFLECHIDICLYAVSDAGFTFLISGFVCSTVRVEARSALISGMGVLL